MIPQEEKSFYRVSNFGLHLHVQENGAEELDDKQNERKFLIFVLELYRTWEIWLPNDAVKDTKEQNILH